jgi:uncharacterized membrane protein YgcG
MRIKKKIYFLLTLIAMMLCCTFSVNAETFAHITDKSGNLPDMELSRLDEILSETSEKTGFNIYVNITDNNDFSEYEDEFHSDTESDRIMMTADISSDTAQIYVCGTAQQYIDDKAKTEILNKKSENISEKIEMFAEYIADITAEINAQQSIVPETGIKSEKKNKPDNKNSTVFIIISGIICGAAVGIFTGLYLKFLYRRHDSEFAVSNYKCTHKITFDAKEDKFKREFVNKSDTSSSS